MTAELINYIDKLNIYVYVLTDGSTIIGKLCEVHESAMELVGVCRLEKMLVNTSLQYLMVPVIPSSLEQTTILAKAHVIMQSSASIVLKKSYCDTLLSLKLNKVNGDPDQPSSNPIDLETTKQIPKQQNPFKNRWS